ncbi:hypothetical protein X975_21330, partial [Stegodyphus mimosarum]
MRKLFSSWHCVVQPLDLGVIKNFKMLYRQRLIQIALQNISTGNKEKKYYSRGYKYDFTCLNSSKTTNN